MTYQGYMALANESGQTIELVNAARVKAYTDNLAPTIGLRGCDDCEGLPEALGEEYTTPEADNAPWYDPTDPETADFYGVYPLAFEGIDDSTRTIESAELTGDGSVVVGSRYTGKDIRVSGMAFAKDEAALYAGMSWLDNALNGTEEGRCFGDRLNLYSSCPPVEVLPPNFATPYTLVNPPSAEELAAWTTTSGTITGNASGVNFLWTAGDPLKVACREITGLIPGEQYQVRFRPETFGNYYLSVGPACAERYTNLIPNPRLGGETMTLQGSTSVDTYPATGSPDGGSFFSRHIVVPNGSSPMTMALVPTGTGAIPVVNDTTYTVSWYAQKIGSGGPATRVDYSWYDGSGALISSHTGAPGSSNATWQRNTQTITSPPTAFFVQIRVAWTGIAVADQTLNIAQVMMNLGSTALPYIDGGYPEARWDGAIEDSSSTVERNVNEQTIFGWARDQNPPTEPTVLDFIARESTIYLSVQALSVSGAAPPVDLQVQQMSIRRISRPGVVAFGTGNDAVPPSDGWTHTAPNTMQVEWFINQSSVVTTAENPSGGSSTYLSSHGPRRTLFGLQPGSRYRVMIQFDVFSRNTDVAPAISVTPRVLLTNAAGTLTTYVDDNDPSFTYFRVVEFTATATSSVLSLNPTSSIALGSFGSVFWNIHEYMVEEILTTDTTPPTPGREQARTMYEVKASQGPILTNVRTSPCGVMGQVTFSLRAGNPFKYRLPQFAGGLPTGTSVQVPDIPCSEDGLAQIINFSYNPSLEEIPPIPDTWLGGGANLTFNGRVISATARLGEYVYRITADSAGSLSGINNYYFPSLTSGGPTPQNGETITVSGFVRAITAGTLGTFTMSVFVTMTGFPPFSVQDTVAVAVLNQWYRLEATFTIPDNVTLSGIETGFFPPPDVAAAVGMEVDALMIQRGTVATDPFAQNTANVEWSDDPNESALLYTPVAEDISEDPDCPTPPSPPAPPQIEDACVTEPSAYDRTVVVITEDAVPRNLTAYPIITLTAGAAAVRQARIRFWPNPDNLTIDQIYPCDYEGEIIVSYLAAGATMVIDGVLREATVTAPGFDPMNANHVLYGADGGPVDWPELTGGIPYLVTLELDSSAAYSDTIMLIDLVVRD